MLTFSIPKVEIAGIFPCVLKNKEWNRDSDFISSRGKIKFIGWFLEMKEVPRFFVRMKIQGILKCTLQLIEVVMKPSLSKKVRKKLKSDKRKMPYSLKHFVNNSCTTISVAIVTEIRKELSTSMQRNIAYGFVVGFSWATLCFEINKMIVRKLVEYDG